MAAKVIARAVPAWPQPAGESLRSKLARDMAHFLGSSAAEAARPLLESASLERLVSVWNRLLYIERVDHLFDPHWSLELIPLSRDELLRHAFGTALDCGLLLEIRRKKPQERDRLTLWTDVPWFALLHESETLMERFLSDRWLVFSCPDRIRAGELQSRVRGAFVRCKLLGSAS